MMSLDDVFVDEEEMNEKELASVLEGRLKVGQNEGRLFYQSNFHDLKSDHKLAIVLLGRKAAEIKGVIEDERAGPKELTDETGMPEGTVKTALKRLRDNNLAQSDNGEYWIPNPNISKIKEELDEEE